MDSNIDNISYMDDHWDILAKCVLRTARDHPSLLQYRPTGADVPGLMKEDALVLDTIEEARMSVLVAEGLLAMSKLIHEPGDQAELDEGGVLTPAKAVVLVKRHGGIRPAARATGINRQALFRAVKLAEEEGIGIA